MQIDKEETQVGAYAILVTHNGKIILHQRDNTPGIINPGLISILGGSLKRNETVINGLKRELLEELDLHVRNVDIKKLGVYEKTKTIDGVNHTAYVFVIRNINVDDLHLHEGKSLYRANPITASKNPHLTRICRLAVLDYIKKVNKLSI